MPPPAEAILVGASGRNPAADARTSCRLSPESHLAGLGACGVWSAGEDAGMRTAHNTKRKWDREGRERW